MINEPVILHLMWRRVNQFCFWQGHRNVGVSVWQMDKWTNGTITVYFPVCRTQSLYWLYTFNVAKVICSWKASRFSHILLQDVQMSICPNIHQDLPSNCALHNNKHTKECSARDYKRKPFSLPPVKIKSSSHHEHRRRGQSKSKRSSKSILDVFLSENSIVCVVLYQIPR